MIHSQQSALSASVRDARPAGTRLATIMATSSTNAATSKWARSWQLPCFAYEATEDGATVEVLRYAMGNLVPFKAKCGLKVTVCGSVAAFDEGFEAGLPQSGKDKGNR
jgi:hypothetical protein